MTEEKKSHWQFLANLLGAETPTEAEPEHVEKKPEATSEAQHDEVQHGKDAIEPSPSPPPQPRRPADSEVRASSARLAAADEQTLE